MHPSWAPIGAARFEELVDADFFNGCRFFRVISGFMAQFGISGKPAVNAEWREKPIKDDPVTQSNQPYTVSFATSGENSRTTQLFINFVDNDRLDTMGFAPFAKIISGFDTVDEIYAEHGETPNQGYIQEQGNTSATAASETTARARHRSRQAQDATLSRISTRSRVRYLKKKFPKLSYITATKKKGTMKGYVHKPPVEEEL